MTRIRYERTSPDWHGDFVARVRNLAVSSGAKRICELGAGANPALPVSYVQQHDLELVLVDVSPEELAKASDEYEKRVLDVASPELQPLAEFDLVFSISLAEHISAPKPFHRNVLSMLKPGGRAAHHFSTLYAAPFVVNRILPELVSDYVIRRFFPRRKSTLGKFPASYRWCRGPLPGQLARLRASGFEVEEYTGFFGHFYYGRLPPLQALEDRVSNWLVDHPRPLLTSYASVILRRPAVDKPPL